jgi:hypothetical protein
VDFSEALVAIGGVEQKGHFLCMDLPQSDDCFVMAFPAERRRTPNRFWKVTIKHLPTFQEFHGPSCTTTPESP